jgi:anti-sigma factor RsiW
MRCPSDAAGGGNAKRGRPNSNVGNASLSPSEPMCEEAATSADGAAARGFSKLKRRHGSQIFAKFDVKSVQTLDVKSRIDWTAQRRQLLRRMWERGERVPAIAAAPGCKAGAVPRNAPARYPALSVPAQRRQQARQRGRPLKWALKIAGNAGDRVPQHRIR